MSTVNPITIKGDVIIIGAGIGAIRAARELLKENIKVVMVTSASFCSGSSFYPKTWGLGMISPKGKEDEEDLLETIKEVSCGVSNLALAKILVENIHEEIEGLKKQGINLKPSLSKEGVIPCFDKHHRNWHGFDFPSARRVFGEFKAKENLILLEHTKVLKIQDGGRGAKGVIALNKEGEQVAIKGKAIIIASGGYTSLFEHNFSLEQNSPIIHSLAQDIGCSMTNLEFIQFIPAYLSPSYKTLFNERAFRYIELKTEEGEPLLESVDNSKELLWERGTYGPFTTRLKSGIIDREIFKYYRKNNKGPHFYYPEGIENIEDTLIYNYFQWLKEKQVGIQGKINIASFAHACNGGITINERAETTVEGVFACGEAAGGVHGADRIGGVATGSALVFGAIAAKSAKKYCEEVELKNWEPEYLSLEKGEEEELKQLITEARRIMYREGSIVRSEASLMEGQTALNNLSKTLEELEKNKKVNTALKLQLISYVKFGTRVLDFMLNRKESLGSHYREDS